MALCRIRDAEAELGAKSDSTQATRRSASSFCPEGAGHRARASIPGRSASARACSTACLGRSTFRRAARRSIERRPTASSLSARRRRAASSSARDQARRRRHANARHRLERAPYPQRSARETPRPRACWSSRSSRPAATGRAIRRTSTTATRCPTNPTRGDLLPSPEAAAGLRLPARLYRRPLARRDADGRRRRRRPGAEAVITRSARRTATTSTT